MLEILMIAALTWPADCLVLGELYHDAALLRDVSGQSLPKVLALAEDRRVRRALIHVYERRDMGAEAWRWFIIGLCSGSESIQRNIKQG